MSCHTCHEVAALKKVVLQQFSSKMHHTVCILSSPFSGSKLKKQAAAVATAAAAAATATKKQKT